MTSGRGLFVTGGSGFVGREVLTRLALAGFEEVACLVRDPAHIEAGRAIPEAWRLIPGDLTESGWEGELPRGGTVVHLAARTGKASSREFRRQNTDATRRLVAAAESAGVARFILMSSVAAKYPDRRWYPYAASKSDAEDAVSESRLERVIIRPTQVFGPGSPALSGFAKLACAPIGVSFGSGSTRVQPVHVGDLAEVVVECIRAGAVSPHVVEVGGSDVLTIRDLLRRLRAASGRGPGPWIMLPTGAVRRILAALEWPFLPILPVTAGQLAAFVEGNNGTASAHPLMARRTPGMKGIEAMVAEWSAND